MHEAPAGASGRGERLQPSPLRTVLAVDGRDLRVAGACLLGGACVLSALPGDAGVPCPLRTLTGVPCPLCGMTTSVKATVGLRLDEAAAATPAGIVAVFAAVLVLVLRPERIRVPALLVYGGLAAMWAFQLARFSVV